MRWCSLVVRHTRHGVHQHCPVLETSSLRLTSKSQHLRNFSVLRPFNNVHKNAAAVDSTLNPTGIASADTDCTSIYRHVNLETLTSPPKGPIVCAGLIRSIRKQKKIVFATLSDGTTLKGLQAILQPADAKDLQNGSYVKLEGTWQASQGSGQKHELVVERVLQHGPSDPAMSPMQKKAMSVDHLRIHPHLRLRLPLYAMLARARALVYQCAHGFYAGGGIRGQLQSDSDSNVLDQALYVQPPLITSSDCEGAGETFTIMPKTKSVEVNSAAAPTASAASTEKHYFRSQKYLTVSSQLHLEAFSAELGNVWTLSPTFRAEESDTARHLSEFWMLESEFRSMDSLDDLMGRVERLLRYIAGEVFEHPLYNELLAYHSDAKHQTEDGKDVDIAARLNAILDPNWTTITYTNAIGALEEAASSNIELFKYAPTWESGLQLEHERWLVEHLGKNKPVFVIRYPQEQKPFYMLNTAGEHLTDTSRPTVECFDLLLPHGICEVAGGSLRQHDLERLITTMREKNLLQQTTTTTAKPNSEAHGSDAELHTDESEYPYLQPGESLNTLQWYTDLRRYGSSPHGGFGMGVDRFIMYLTGIHHVRDVVPFPRTFGTAHC